MVAVYDNERQGLVADSCIKQQLAGCDEHIYSHWVMWHPNYREQILQTVYNVASDKRFLYWDEIFRLGIPFCYIIHHIGDIVIIPPGWLHQVGNVCVRSRFKKPLGASLKLGIFCYQNNLPR